MHRFTVSLTARVIAGWLLIALHATAQSNVTLRLMAANLNGNVQSIQPFTVNIYKGLKPDIVCVQEFNYSNNTAANFRQLLDDAFGTNFTYYRESSSFQIPNGIISRYPILASGSWNDAQQSQPNRGFAWARIDVPGSNDLYVVSVHLLTADATTRNAEGTALRSNILAAFPTNAWIVIGGDFNTDSTNEAVITTLATVAVNKPQPTDAESGGKFQTNNGRNKPYDYLLISPSLTNYFTPVVFPSHTFSNGLVFDSRVYTPLSDVPPVISTDSSTAQHMAVLKDFSIPVSGSNAATAPIINTQPQSQTVAVGNPVTFTVAATGTAPLAYQWRFNGTNLAGANTNVYTLASAQTASNGNYTVVITNSAGSVTSSVAVLTVSNIPPSITTNPASLQVFVGDTVAFTVSAAGTAPLRYQWRFNGTNLAGETNIDYTFNNAQTNHAGNYTVVVTNQSGSVTSAVAVLSVSNGTPVILTNPAPRTVSVGATATFAVVADGSNPLEYQWRFNGTDIAGADTATYSLTNVQGSNAGNYSVVVTNLAGAVTSSVVALTVTSNSGTISATNVVISQIYGGGGNSGATYKNDYVELFNPTASAISVASWSVQYASATGTGWTAAALTGTIQPYHYYLVQLAGGTTGATLPTVDATGSMNMSATAGKVALASSTTALSGAIPVSATLIDLVGYGGTANGYEGSAPAVGGSNANTNAIFRLNGGFTDTQSNTNDFTTGANNPRNSSVTNAPPTPPTPAATPGLSAPNYTNNQFSFLVTGTATTNYVVQGSTNLVVTNWVALRTNAAPFTFTQSNAATFPLRFFRAILP